MKQQPWENKTHVWIDSEVGMSGAEMPVEVWEARSWPAQAQGLGILAILCGQQRLPESDRAWTVSLKHRAGYLGRIR